MKNFTLSVVVVILSLFNFTVFGQGGWYLQNNPTTSRGVSTKFVSAAEGWMNLSSNLSSNALLHTTNGGANWIEVVPNATDITVAFDATSQTMSFINSSTGWVLKTLSNSNEDALGAIVYKTINGGATWNRTVLSNTVGDVGIQLQFIDAYHGWASIYNFGTKAITFKKTIDGGATWTATNGGGIFYYVNATTGYAFAAGPDMLPPYTIYKTTDGGTNWTPQYVDNTAGELGAIHFTDVNNGWIVGSEGKILKTTNGGANWTTITNTGINSTYRNLEVQFLTANLGWIATRDDMNNQLILKTTNGGTSWTMQSIPFQNKVNSMFFWDANNGWVTSDSYNQGGTDYPGQIAKYLYNPAGTYTNATLNGPWLVYTDLTPIDPFNDNLNYFVFSGSGFITDFNGFGGPWFGNYTVNSSGVISGNLSFGIENYSISGLLTSTTEGTAQLGGQNWRLHKVANPGALKDKITGTLTTNDCGSRNVTINIDNNGIITSATGLAGPVVGRVYTDLGVYIGHMTTGEGVHWSELTIRGYYSNNNLVGQLALDADSTTCVNGISNLVRSDNQPINTDWVAQNSNTTNDLKSAFFTDANNGYVVGGGQAGQSLLKTTDGGTNWMKLNSSTPYDLNSVFTISSNVTYCVGGDGSPNQTILKTINGGSNWTILAGNGVTQLNSLFFVNSNLGYAVGGGNNTGQNIILKTIDGGANWTTQTCPFNNLTLYSVFFLDENTGYIVGESGMSGTILKTTNGGSTWIQQTSGTMNHLYSVFFINANNGFIVGNNGTILKTINGGTNWIQKASGTSVILNSVNFLNANVGFAVGETGTILKTTNGGEDWILQASGTTANLNSVYLNNNVGYAVGESGTILKNNNVSLDVKENIADKFISIYPNPSTGTFYFSLKEANSKVKAEIYTLTGQKVFEASNFEMQPQNEVNFAPQSKGIYIIKINDGENSYSEKILIK